MKIAEFHGMCPNCGGIISDLRLWQGIPCEKCLPEVINYENKKEICNALGKKLEGYKKICELEEFIKDYVKFFEDRMGFAPWNLQITWAKRVLLGKSFTMIAPTGIGKTTWGIVTSLYLEGKSYILVPTKMLVLQTLERLSKLTDKKIVAYTGKKSEKAKIEGKEFDILITTTNFLYKNFNLIPKPFNFIFVDDVDSLLKSAKNIDKIIQLLGFSEKDIKLAMEVLKLKSFIAKSSKKIDSRILNKIKKLEDLINEKREKLKNVLIVSSATSQPRSGKIKLFREMLGFEVGKSVTNLRNVKDILLYTKNDYLEETAKFIKKYGNGVFIFVSEDMGKDYVKKVVDFLNKEKITSVSYEDFTPENQEKFVNKEIEAVVGISSYRNPLARGIDLPFSVRYAIFIGVPKLEFSLKLSLSPAKLFGILLVLKDIIDDGSKVMSYLSYLKKYLSLKEELIDKYPKIKTELEKIKLFIETHLNDANFWDKIKTSKDVSLKVKGKELYIVVGDAKGYIQASGRTSRMFAGGLTKGVSFMFVDDLKALNSLKKRLSIFLEDVSFKVLDYKKGKELSEKFGFKLIDERTVNEYFAKVDEDRNKVKEFLIKKAKPKSQNLLSTALIVVESPNKARTIGNFFGKPIRRKIYDIDAYEVNVGNKSLIITASKGHVFDITKRDGLWGVKMENNHYVAVYDTIKYCTDCGEQTTETFCTRCKDKPDIDKIQVIKGLRELALEVDEIYIASDPDTEGEKIGWDIANVLRPYQSKIKRIEFHEITKWAFLRSFEKARELDKNLVKGQILRRIADRWVGFSLSQHIQNVFKKTWLSAGRVQTPVLGWIVERYEKSKEKKGVLEVNTEIGNFKFEFDDLKEFEDIKVEKITLKLKEKYTSEINPPPPFNTGELLKEVSNMLGLSTEEIMNIAQDLFENGFITYHRTDSTRVSPMGMMIAKEYISEKYGPQFVRSRTWDKGGAHECIRPTRPLSSWDLKSLVMVSGSTSKMSEKHFKVYDILFRRFIASQMIPLKVEKLNLSVRLAPQGKEIEEERITKIVEDGFNLITPIKFFPLSLELDKNKTYSFKITSYKKKKVPKIYPFTQGELVKEMKKRGLGRPSTYAKIIQTILERKYAIQNGKFLYPTELGRKVYQYLSLKFPKYTSEDFTKEIESLMDKVEKGEADYQRIIDSLRPILKV